MGPGPAPGRAVPVHGREGADAPARGARVVRAEGAMNGRDFLPAARRLANSADEADWRSAASRAYYAAFHAARDLVTDLRFRAPRADRAHNYLYALLKNCGEPFVLLTATL